MVRQEGRVVAVSLLVVLALAVGVAVVPGAAGAQDDEVDQDLIDEANEGIDITNEGLETELYPQLEETEHPAGLESIEAETTAELEVAYEELDEDLDRLTLEMLHAVVHEINANSPIGDIIDPADVTEPDDAREEGDGFVDEYGHLSDRAEEGQEGLYRVADSVEDIYDRFDPILEAMEVELYGEPVSVAVTGTVTDSSDDPIEGVTVSADGEESTTDADGSYELDLSGATVTLTFEHDEFETAQESVDLGSGESSLSVDAQLEAGGDGADDGDDDGLAGFGIVAGLLALLTVATVAYGRRIGSE